MADKSTDSSGEEFLNLAAAKALCCRTWGGFKKLPVIRKVFDKRPEVVTLRLSGVIADQGKRGGGKTISHHAYAEAIDKAFERKDAKAVALIINSPGGSPAQSSLIASHIRRLAEKEEKKVYAFVEDVAASGGYWLACAADEIYAQPASITGSIGVISAGFGFQDFIAKHGVERRVYTSGKDKSFMDPFSEEKPEDLKRIQAVQKEIHKLFIDWVKERRGAKLNGTDKTLFEGQFWTAVPAMEKGLIDGIGDVMSVLQEVYGEKLRLKDVSPGKGFLPLPFLSGRIDHSADDMIYAYTQKQARARFGI